ncbi:unnamed protein product [Prunus armeniaca]
MVNLNWPEHKRSRSTTEASSSRGRIVTRETIERPKAIISAGVVLCCKCKCETKLKVVLDRQSQPIPSVFDRIVTSSRDRAKQKDYPRPAERPKKEIPIKMPENEKPLATIIEGRWYSMGKSGRPTLELTRTQKRMVQRQYCTFLKSKSNAQVLPEASSVRKGKEPEVSPLAEQTTCQAQKLLEPSQVQGESKPIPAKEQEDWTGEYEEEQLDYEPSTDDQNGLLETGEQEDWTEEYEEEQMKYDRELDEETEAFGAELESLLAEVEETLEQQPGNPKNGRTANKPVAEQLCFSKPTKEMTNHLRPLFITANFGGIPIPKVIVDGGAAINLLPHRMLSKMGRTEKDLIPRRLAVTNFAGGITKTREILDVDVIVGSKEQKIAFFVVDTTSTTYNALLGRDWIHQILCVPSTLHQQLALWNEEGYMESRGQSTTISAFCHVF